LFGPVPSQLWPLPTNSTTIRANSKLNCQQGHEQDSKAMPKVMPQEHHEPRLMISLRGSIRRRLTASVLIHTLAAQLTIAFTEAALGLDGLGYLMAHPRLEEVGCWALVGAVGFATIAALAGAVMRRRYRGRRKESRTFLRAHLWLGILFYAMLVAMMVWRISIRASDEPTVGLLYLAALLGVSLVMIFQTYLGGEVAYHFATEREPIPLIPKRTQAASSQSTQLARER
jgi:uncharacterized membrane protein